MNDNTKKVLEDKFNDLFLRSSEVDSLLEQIISTLYANGENKKKVYNAVNALEGVRNYHKMAVTNSAWEVENIGIEEFLKEAARMKVS